MWVPPFRSSEDFDFIAAKLRKYHGIPRELASKRLHYLKQSHGFGGADNVVIDYCGNVFNPFTGDPLGSLTLGGSREKA